MPREVGTIRRHIFRHRYDHRMPEGTGTSRAIHRHHPRQNKRFVLRANDVIRRCHAGCSIARHLGAIQIVHDFPAGAK